MEKIFRKNDYSNIRRILKRCTFKPRKINEKRIKKLLTHWKHRNKFPPAPQRKFNGLDLICNYILPTNSQAPLLRLFKLTF